MLLRETIHTKETLNHYMCYEISKKNARNNGEINSPIAFVDFSLGVNDLRALILFKFQMSSSSKEKAGERYVICEVNERDFIMQGIISYIERESCVQVIKCLGPKNWLEYDS